MFEPRSPSADSFCYMEDDIGTIIKNMIGDRNNAEKVVGPTSVAK